MEHVPGLIEERGEEKWTVVQVRPHELDACWGRIEAALDHAPEMWSELDTKENIYASLRDGYCQCWIAFRWDEAITCMFTRLLEFPSGIRVVRAWGMVGELEDSLPVLAVHMRAYCARQMATRFEVEGRLGWMRLLRHFGMEVERVILKIDLKDRMH